MKALRIAAYLLIAHFLIATLLGLASRGALDYQRLVMTLALLVVAVSALFKPRGKGWIAIVAYALYVLAYQVFGLWSFYAGSPAAPLVTKIVVALVWILINAMPAAALVLTLLPANFAAFAKPAGGQPSEEPAGPGVGFDGPITVAGNALATRRRYVPVSNSRWLAGVVAALAALYAVLAIVLVINALRAPISLAVAPLFAVLSWGLWRLKTWARWITVFVLWFCVIVIPIGVLNPFAAMEWEGGAPRWELLASCVALGVALGLFLLHILGKHKREFTW